jgi:predicted nucleic acid-binding protein
VITIDASVLVAAATESDPAWPDAAAFMNAALAAGVQIHQPTLALIEVGAAIARRTGNSDLAMDAGEAILGLPGLMLQELDIEASTEAAALAGRLQLRGADAVYAATALRHSATLVTLDEDQRSRSSAVLDAMSPTDWLARARRVAE